MNSGRHLLSFLLSANLMFAPLMARAQNKNEQPEGSASHLHVQNDPQNNRLTFSEVDGNGHSTPVGEMDLGGTSPQETTDNMPSNLNEMIRKVQMQARQQAKFSNIALQSFQHMPVTQLSMYIGFGALTLIQLKTNYEKNPTSLKKLNDNYGLTPIGLVSLYAFMLSSGYTTAQLSLLFGFGHFWVEWAGMTAGMFAQNTLSKLLSSQDVRACITQMTSPDGSSKSADEKAKDVEFPNLIREQKLDACDRVFSFYALKNHIVDAAPDLLTMLFASGAAKLLQKKSAQVTTYATKAAVDYAGKYVQTKGLGLALNVIPGSGEVRAVGFFVRGLVRESLNFALFSQFQDWIGGPMDRFWTNTVDARRFNTFNDDFVKQIAAEKANGWKLDPKGLPLTVTRFSDAMQNWRVSNSNASRGEFAAWNEMLIELAGKYRATNQFYSTVLNELNNPKSRLDQPYPLNGVGGLPADHSDGYFTNPDDHQVTDVQKYTIQQAANAITQNLYSGFYKTEGMSADGLKKMTSLRDALKSSDLNVYAQAVLAMNAFIASAPMNAENSLLKREYRRVYTMLGHPEPLLEPNRGFFATMENNPGMIDAFKDVNFPATVGIYTTRHITSYFLMQMICGPHLEKGAQLIQVTRGYPAQLVPPAITVDTPERAQLCRTQPGMAFPEDQLFKFKNSKYTSVIDYIRKNLSPDLKTKKFSDWWKPIEDQMVVAYKGFFEKYKYVIKDLDDDLNRQKTDLLNTGPIPNGLLDSQVQEARVYFMILNELMKDGYKAKNHKDIPDKDPNRFYTPDFDKISTLLRMNPGSASLLLALGHGTYLDFHKLVQDNKSTEYTVQMMRQGTSLFEQYRLFMTGLRWTSHADSKLQCVGGVEEEDYDQNLKTIMDYLNVLAVAMGVAKDGVDKSIAVASLTPAQQALAVTCLNSLRSLASEMRLYGGWINAAWFTRAAQEMDLFDVPPPSGSN